MGIKIKLKDMTVDQFRQFKGEVCRNLKCDNCPFNYVNCVDSIDDSEMTCSWVHNKELYSAAYLEKEVEIPLPREDKTLLQFIPKKFKYAARDKTGDLYLFECKPRFDIPSGLWTSARDYVSFEVFNDYFKYIKCTDKEPTLIEDLLKE